MFPSRPQHFTGVFLYPETVISTLLTNPRHRKQMLHLSPRPPSKLVQVRNSIGAMKNTLLFKVSRDYSTQFYGDYKNALIRIPINQSVWKVIRFFVAHLTGFPFFWGGMDLWPNFLCNFPTFLLESFG